MADVEGKVKLDHKGIAELLKSEKFAAVMDEAAHAVAEAARPHVKGSPVPVHEYTTDRAAASVSVLAPFQANHGVLTQAAESVGLELRERA